MWLSLCLGGVLACAAEEEEGDGVIDTSEECEDAGGYVIVSPAGRIDCRLDEELIGTIPQGIEGAICCRERPPVDRGPSTIRDRSQCSRSPSGC